MAETLTAEQAQTLLDGIDSAFEAVLQGRFGGGISACFSPADGSAASITLRSARAGTAAFIRMNLLRDDAAAGSGTDGVPIGTAQLTAGANPAVLSITVQTEIFLDHDVNESSDATALCSGMLLEHAPASLPNGGLLVVRSTEAARSQQQLALAEQQNWRPNPSRHVASSGFGASGRSHRRAGPASLVLPVSADLLTRLGAAVAAAHAEVAQVAVVLLPDGMAG